MSSSIESDPSISQLVTEILRLFSRNFTAHVQDYGLTHTQWQALAVLAQNESIKQAVLADLLQVQPISLGRLIDRLEAAGWVERRRASNDRRTIQLYLTPKVRPILDKITDIASLTCETALADFDTHERKRLIQMLQHVKTNLAGSVSLETEHLSSSPQASHR